MGEFTKGPWSAKGDISTRLRPFVFIAVVITWSIWDSATYASAIVVSTLLSLLVFKVTQSTGTTCPPVNPAAQPSGTRCVPVNPDAQDDLLHVNAKQASEVKYYKSDPKQTWQLHHWLLRMERAPRQGTRVDSLLFARLVSLSFQEGDAHRLQRIVTCMENCNLYPAKDVYYRIVSLAIKGDELTKALFWFERLQRAGIKANVHMYTSLIHACAKAEKHDEAMMLCQKMVSEGISPPSVTINALVNACAESRRPDLAEHWLKVMSIEGVTTSRYPFESIINAYVRVGEPERAEFWLNEMMRSGLNPDISIFSAIIHSLKCSSRRQGHAMQANRLLRNLISRGTWCQTQMPANYEDVIIICAGASELELAENWLQAAEDSGIKIGPQVYKSLVCAFTNQGRELDAARVYRLLQASDRPPTKELSGEGFQ